MPCQLAPPQCGCAQGDECNIDAMGKPICTKAGVAGPGAPCDAMNQCAPGDVCLGPQGSSVCFGFCAKDQDCNGGLCALQVTDAMNKPYPGVTVCSSVCEPIANTGCPNGDGCQLGVEATGQMRDFTICGKAGAGTQGSKCTTNADCAGSYSCLSTDGGVTFACYRYCDFNGMVGPKCQGVMNCAMVVDANMKPFVVNGVTYGACL